MIMIFYTKNSSLYVCILYIAYLINARWLIKLNSEVSSSNLNSLEKKKKTSWLIVCLKSLRIKILYSLLKYI